MSAPLSISGIFSLCKRFFLPCLLFISDNLFSQGDLLITPRRLVFEGSRRSIDINLANSGNDTATYAISLIQIRMTENGAFEQISEPDPGQLFADKNIRFFPRTVTLAPAEAQVVKVQLYRANQLSEGEYRSHFYFRAVPKVNPLGETEQDTDTSAISVVIRPIFGITIPVIVRVGNPHANVILSNLSLKRINDTIPDFSLTFNRSGNASIYGDLAVYHISPQGKETKVGIANGIAVYTPNTKRIFHFNLNNVPGVDYTSGTLRAVFSAPSDVKPERYAEGELQLN